VLVHGFTGGTDGAYQPVSLKAFTDSVQHSKDYRDVWIDSVVNVAAYWLGQKAFTNAVLTQPANEMVVSWQLPAHFPAGKFLRVTVSGGTLEQNGQPLSWDAHGYYEVALDGGPLTLRP
jgi:hypothetical protein